MEHKGGHWYVHEEYIVLLQYAKRHLSGWSSVKTVNNVGVVQYQGIA